MIVQEFISNEIQCLHQEDDGAAASKLMLASQVFDLPVLDNDNHLIGMASLTSALEHEDESVEQWMTQISQAPLSEFDSIWKACRILTGSEWDSFAVADKDGAVKGVVVNEGLVQQLSDSLSLQQDGNYIVLEMIPKDYSLAKISGIIEQEDVRILMSWIDNLPETNRIRVTVKVNTDMTDRLESSLHRFGYEVVAVLGNVRESSLSARFDALMKYLDI